MEQKNSTKAGISIIMPTYNQASFIAGAIRSLQLQTYGRWELILINDGATDETDSVIATFLKDARIRYFINDSNIGLGACLNKGIDLAEYGLIAYLPSDDIYYSNHLESLNDVLGKNKDSVLVYSGLKYNSVDSPKASSSRYDQEQAIGHAVQLVQVLHKKTEDRWVERDELVTNDLYEMFWKKIMGRGECIPTKSISCEWTLHHHQRHRIIIEMQGGGIYKYKQFYKVDIPLRFKSSSGSLIDEQEQYKAFRNVNLPQTRKGLKILLVGELAYNAERICTLEQRGCQLYGLWIDEPLAYNTVGPLPFGNVEDIPLKNWKDRVKEIQPDIIYALLNYQAVPLAHEVLMQNLGIPFIWHFKEGPFYCRQLGTWKKLIDLYSLSDGQIYINNECKDWFEQYLASTKIRTTFIMDGDLPSSKWFADNRSELLSSKDGEIHTVAPGRLMGINPEDMEGLAAEKIHLHLYGNFYHTLYQNWIHDAQKVAKGYLHLHPICTQRDWVSEFSKYDAGWLHVFDSKNHGELMRTSWDDLNYPARLSTLAMAGVPMIQKNNEGHNVATQTITKNLDVGVFYDSVNELRSELMHKEKMTALRENLWVKRERFSFDYYVEDLLQFFSKLKTKKSACRLRR